MRRNQEVYQLLQLEPEQLLERTGGRLVIVENLEKLHAHFALSLVDQIEQNNRQNRESVFILPYGPAGQYPIFIEIVNRKKISLAGCRFFFMDEYADANGIELATTHHESFQAGVEKIFRTLDSRLGLDFTKVIFPSSQNIDELPAMIEAAGGIQICYGGIGIHGHLAFNEPAAGIRNTDPRVVELNDFTVTMNAIRSGIGGDLVNFPRKALTLGMKQILGADKIRLYCRNDIPGIDWANTILRLAALGTPGDDFPVTHIRDHADWMIITDRNTARKPDTILPVIES